MKKNVVIGVGGGIAAYKVCALVSSLRKKEINVDVIMTEHATEFVRPLTFETLSANPVITSMFKRERSFEPEHISLAKKADVFVIAPATANIIGKLANGIADDMLSTTAMAVKCPIIIAPAMNCNMLECAAVRHNLGVLADRGVVAVYGNEGFLACGDIGKGRMAEPDVLEKAIFEALNPKRDLEGKRALVALGGTSENIDGVRFITNRSS
ncbi:MAG: bifunctional phosphopantothenoylcysteine decarboxylase/phosphopantothenate--cysteine ligase CoaBC, partial [Clostridia bacterium]|nr:bifunctional phosphopantothenoylcysteine decarboxylase/phosphopantothenate--cysteine ligase CoaBC [Clostridia bacterium]